MLTALTKIVLLVHLLVLLVPGIILTSEIFNMVVQNIILASPTPNDSIMQSLENTGIFDDAYDDREVGADAELYIKSRGEQSQRLSKLTICMFSLTIETQKVWTLVVGILLKVRGLLGLRGMYIRNQKDERGIVVRNKARLMDVKSAFLYGTIEEEVYVCQPPSFEDP
ncbi:hypothetical protein Tco_0388819 [Tanacetum coccineum]